LKPSHDDFPSNFESRHTNAQTSEAKTPGATDVERRETHPSRDRAAGSGSHAPNAGDPAEAARECAEETGEEEIEVTEEMISAGIEEIILSFSLDGQLDDYEVVVVGIFKAMRRAEMESRRVSIHQ
jgi:hypothetical protein